MSDIYTTLAVKIIKEQEAIIGPLAWSQADDVNGLDISDHTIVIKGDGKTVLEALVTQYSTLFGQASIEVCKDAVKKSRLDIDPAQLPQILVS